MGGADGVHHLDEAARFIVREWKREDVQFLLMGSGPEHEALVKQRDALGLRDFVSMPGRVSDEYLFTALKTMDLGVACDPINDYNDHCTMNKTLEYMAFGKAQVMFATREGRFSAGDAARYVTENSPEKLADAIVRVLDDPAERARMGRVGRERLEDELGWKRAVCELLKAYERVMAAGPPADLR
jgi:glycosyltransferase involved in cell wall biosynthesis